MGALLRLAWRNVFRHRGRTAMTLAAVVFGVVALILAGGFVEDTLVETGEAAIRSNTGHLQVTVKGFREFGSQQPERYLIADAADLRQRLQATPGAEEVMFRLHFSGLLGNGKSDWAILGEGVEPEPEARLASYMTLLAGRPLAGRDHFAMMIGAGVAKALKLGVGETATLLVSTPEGATNVLDFEVVGIFQTFSKDFDARAVRIPLAAAQELLATPGAHVGVVRLRETAFTETAVRHLRSTLDPARFESMTWIELNPFYTQTVTLYRQQFGFLVAIILVMLVLSVSNTIHIGIFERTAEFGTMLAMGNRSAQVFALIVAESALIGIVGSLLGVGLGALLAQAISAVGIPMPPPPNADQGYVSRIVVTSGLLLLAAGTGALAALVAALAPARRVSRMDIAEALRQGV